MTTTDSLWIIAGAAALCFAAVISYIIVAAMCVSGDKANDGEHADTEGSL